MISVIPGILATTDSEYKMLLERLQAEPTLEGSWVQLDLMDGRFVDNKSVGPEVIAKYPNNFQLEAQLMVDYPGNWIDELVKIEVKRIIFPVEDNENIAGLIEQIKNFNKEVGLSVNPLTSLSVLDPFLEKLDIVLVMSVEPGFGGQGFITGSIDKVKELAKIRRQRKLDFLIEVDGGVTEENVKLLVEAGADNLVIGAKRLEEGDIDETLEKIWEQIQA